jgi:tetratricopeptide (TPR) repeat protein
MVSKLNATLVTIVIAGIVLALTALNRDTATISLLPGLSYTASLGVIAICLLLVGIICGAAIGTFYGIKSYFAHNRLLKKEKEEKESVALLLTSRTALSTKEFGKARSALEKLSKRENYRLLANIELTKVIQAQGDLEGSRLLIDDLRKNNPDEFEVLLRSAEIHEACGNKTAALDALGLILLKFNSEYVARMARDIAYSLERYDDALTFHEKLETFLRGKDDFKAEILFKILKNEVTNSPDKYEQGVKSILKQFPKFAPALEVLAQKEIERGNPEKAAGYLLRKAEVTHSLAHWDELRRLWISQGSPERALSAANIALRETSPEHKIEVELARVRLLIGLTMNEDAEKSLLALEKNQSYSSEIEQRVRLLKLVLSLPGGQARDELLAIVDGKKPLALVHKNMQTDTKGNKNTEAPPARLSTP